MRPGGRADFYGTKNEDSQSLWSLAVKSAVFQAGKVPGSTPGRGIVGFSETRPARAAPMQIFKWAGKLAERHP